ncbi:hypothetical protein K431DRAFT_198793, partial [Polychaeton citri CBS 116435]
MCRHYAHSHRCGHTRTVFAMHCPPAALIQQPCGENEIWTTIKMETDCLHC